MINAAALLGEKLLLEEGWCRCWESSRSACSSFGCKVGVIEFGVSFDKVSVDWEEVAEEARVDEWETPPSCNEGRVVGASVCAAGVVGRIIDVVGDEG